MRILICDFCGRELNSIEDEGDYPNGWDVKEIEEVAHNRIEVMCLDCRLKKIENSIEIHELDHKLGFEPSQIINKSEIEK